MIKTTLKSLLILTIACLLLITSCNSEEDGNDTRTDPVTEKMTEVITDAVTEALPEENEMKIRTAPDPRNREDVVVITCDVTDFGAVADSSPKGGGTDNTRAFTKALNEASKLGGGVVYVPAGYYRVDDELTIPRSVYLVGDWYDPDTTPDKIASGSMIVTSCGKDDPDAAFITIGASAGVMGLTFLYPEQTPDHPSVYAPTVLLKDSIAGDGTQHAASAVCVTFINSYTAIDASRGNQLHFVDSARVTAFNLGFWVNQCYDCGRVMSLSVKPDYYAAFISATGGDGNAAKAAAAASMKENTTGICLMRTDWQMMYDITVESCNVGFSLLRNPHTQEETAGNGSVIEYSITDCVTGIDCAYGGYQFSLGSIKTESNAVILRETAVSNFSFYDSVISSGDAAILTEEGSRGMLSIQSCSFNGWGNSAIRSAGGSVEIQSCDFTGQGRAIDIASTARTAVVDGNTFADTVIEPCVNALEGEHKTFIGSNPPIEKSEFVLDFGIAPVVSDITDIVSVADFGASGKAVCGSADNPDDTPAFEAAIAALSSNGGIVYVPAGYYNVTGNLTIPSGVELRGVHQSLHVTTGEGSVIFVTAGKGEENGTPFITLEKGAGVRGLTFWYPEQNYKDIVAYPWLIRGVGQDVWVRDVCVGNCYQAIDLGYSDDSGKVDCGGHYVENVTGCILKNGIRVDGSTKAGRILNTHFNLTFYAAVWGTRLTDASGSFGEGDMGVTLMGYLNSNLTAYTFGTTVDESALFIFNYRAATGMRFTGGFEGNICGSGVDGSSVGIHITGAYEKPLRLLNFADDIVPGSSKVGNVGIYCNPDEGSEVHFVSSGASSYNYVPPFLVRAVSGKLVLRGFNANVSPRGSSAAILVDGGDVVASGITFKHVGPLEADGSFSRQTEKDRANDVKIKSGSISLMGATANYFFRYDTEKGECSAFNYTIAE
ncbi:MAG: hypothetical protein J6I45_05835 [Clostridia bacterium]|nr:hypothetical protein [Clostridia bacterium]